MTYLALNSHLSREPKSMILCESLTPLTLGRGVSYKVGDLRQVSYVKTLSTANYSLY